jgi:hypothetical protein
MLLACPMYIWPCIFTHDAKLTGKDEPVTLTDELPPCCARSGLGDGVRGDSLSEGTYDEGVPFDISASWLLRVGLAEGIEADFAEGLGASNVLKRSRTLPGFGVRLILVCTYLKQYPFRWQVSPVM